MTVEVVCSADALRQMADEWSELYAKCSNASPFLHPSWQMTWWECFGRCELHGIAIRRDKLLAAFTPLYLYEGRLVFVGNGISDQLGVLAVDREAAGAMVQALREAWYGLDLQEIPEGSPLLELEHEQCSVSPALDLRVPLPSKIRKNARLQWKYLNAAAQAQIETVVAQDLDSALGDLFELHALRWSERGQDGVLASDAVKRFHAEIAPQFLRHGMLRMYRLRADGSTIGVLYGFRGNGTTYYYLGGFHPEWERFSPGTLLIHHAIGCALAEGDARFNFLRGGEAYKYRWGAIDNPQFHVRTR